MPFGPVDPHLDLVAVEARALARWGTDDLAAQVRSARAGGPPWTFYEGPPTANGRPGLHHVWARAFKDLFPRFQTMRGHNVPRKGGWDCHGLPVELEVEKELGLHTKHEIEDYGIAEFNQRCRDSVHRYVEDWTALTSRSGIWIDTKEAYWTLSNDYVESVWWLVKQMWDRGLLYEGHRVSPYCARCGTALSSHEVAQGYKDVVDPSVYVRFPLSDEAEADTGPRIEDGSGSAIAGADLLVWTTTPWTLVSNVAAAVGPDVTYVRVVDPTGGHDLIMAETAAARRYPDREVLARFAGTDLVGRHYQRPFAYLPMPDGFDALRVVAAQYVSTDDGSGIVHQAPAFGEEDAAVARAEGLPVLNPVDADGAFDHTVAPFTGRFVKDADRDLITDLAARGLLVAEEPYEHSYPHCWRCGTPLIYWAKTSWFARTSEHRDALLRENERIGWHPEHLKHGRFGKWLEGNVDWALSRDRYWGTPLPIWRCSDGHDTCIGTVSELAGLTVTDLGGLDLHRPYVDGITFVCPTAGCSAIARRLPPVLDAWFDSGSMPSAQQHFLGGADRPDAFPADFICEAIDQTRGWFYSLLAVNTLVFNQTPYRNVVCLGHIVDEDGQKMSKSKGNVIDPWDIFNRFGADALRWYFFSAGQPWVSRRVHRLEDGIRESTRQTLITLWNVFSFFATYADLDGWTPPAGGSSPAGQLPAGEPTHLLDRWVLGELDRTVTTITAALDRFDALAAATALAAFVDDLSNWYLRRSRPRFWKSSDPDAHRTLHECLVVTARLLAPFCPFLADEIHTALVAGASVHLSDWPTDRGRSRADLAEPVRSARRLVALGRAARTDAKVKVRQPLSRALLLHPGGELADDVRAEIESELNVKVLEEVDTLSGLMAWTVVPNFRLLGPRLGPKVNEVKAALSAADGSVVRKALEADGWVEVAGERLTAAEVDVRAVRHESFALAEDQGWAVALDLELDRDLRQEGLVRELIRVVNDLRKTTGLAIADRVRVTVGADAEVTAAVEAHLDTFKAEVLAVEVTWGTGEHRVDLDGHAVWLSLTRA